MTEEKHIFSMIVDNQPGVLSRVVGLFSGRGFNIESLCVAETMDPLASRITIVTKANRPVIEQIEKQLNKVDLVNRFSKAVFFANNQEFQDGTRDEQKIATACKVLIQNAIVLWNTLYLSQRLSSTSNVDEQREMLNAITGGSLLTWQHVNLQGEYDFRQVAANDEPYDMKQILALRLR